VISSTYQKIVTISSAKCIKKVYFAGFLIEKALLEGYVSAIIRDVKVSEMGHKTK